MVMANRIKNKNKIRKDAKDKFRCRLSFCRGTDWRNSRTERIFLKDITTSSGTVVQHPLCSRNWNFVNT